MNTKTILEPSREIPVAGEYDVLVLGAGPAGFSAAVCAARQGMKTMLVEQTGDLGGVATVGLMSHWTGGTDGGFYMEILERSADTDYLKPSDETIIEKEQIINPEKLKTVMLEMLEESGAHLLLYTMACEPVMDGDKITGVIVENKSGRQAILSKIVIDCSGDGDIAARAGAPFVKGRETDGKMQPMTIMFKVAGVDIERGVFPCGFEVTFPVPKGDLQTLGKEHLPYPAGHVLLYRSTLPGIVTCNMTNCTDVDGTSGEDLTKATFVCRKQMDTIVKFLREYVPGFEECYIISSSSFIGVRETRHFIGEKQITEEDVAAGRSFEDWAVTRSRFGFDVHNMSGSGLDEEAQEKPVQQAEGYSIPYGCLVPKKVENLLLAGRNISGTHLAHASYRVMPICANMGQAAGVAAALCVEKQTTPRKLDVKILQEKLLTQGVTN